MIKNRFRDDYSQYTKLNGKGRVVDDICYTGDYYILPFDREKKRKANLVNLGIRVFVSFLWLLTGRWSRRRIIRHGQKEET